MHSCDPCIASPNFVGDENDAIPKCTQYDTCHSVNLGVSDYLLLGSVSTKESLSSSSGILFRPACLSKLL